MMSLKTKAAQPHFTAYLQHGMQQSNSSRLNTSRILSHSPKTPNRLASDLRTHQVAKLT